MDPDASSIDCSCRDCRVVELHPVNDEAQTILSALRAVTGDPIEVSASPLLAGSPSSGPTWRTAAEDVRRIRDALDVIVASVGSTTPPAVPMFASALRPDSSLGELANRVDMLALLIQIEHLAGILSRPAERERARGLFTGRFQDFVDLSEWVIDAVARVNRAMLRYGRASRCIWGPSSQLEELHAILQAAARDAQMELMALWGDPDFGHFVNAGARHSCSVVQAICERLLRMRRSYLHAQLDAALPADSRPVHAPSETSGEVQS